MGQFSSGAIGQTGIEATRSTCSPFGVVQPNEGISARLDSVDPKICRFDIVDGSTMSVAVDSDVLEQDLFNLVLRMPGETGGYYARRLRVEYPGLRRKDINHILYGSLYFQSFGNGKPAWYVVDEDGEPQAVEADEVPAAVPAPRSAAPEEDSGWWLTAAPVSRQLAAPHANGVSMCGWQEEARSAWYANGGCGIVEAVTGSGKTRVAQAVIGDELQAGRRILVVVPTIALQKQWSEEIRELFPAAEVALVGGDGLPWVTPDSDVTVGVVNTVGAKWETFTFVDTVIADECHNYGSEVRRRALLPGATRRLGLTATLERLDGAVDDIIKPYFGRVVYECGFDRAFDDGRIAAARIGLVGVKLEEDAYQEYTDATDTMNGARTKLIRRFGVAPSPFGEFMKQVAALTKGPWREPSTLAAKEFMSARNKRIDLLANCPEKTQMILDLAQHIEDAGGTLVFSERIAAAEVVSSALRDLGLATPSYHSKLPDWQRAQMLQRLEAGELHGLCTAKALDEGIDLPEVDLGIIAAGTQQRRQMVQRLGRVLRPKADGGPGRFLIAFVHGTFEDPAEGAHEGFFELVREIHGSIRVFDDASEIDAIRAFLDGDDSVGALLPEAMGARNRNCPILGMNPQRKPALRRPRRSLGSTGPNLGRMPTSLPVTRGVACGGNSKSLRQRMLSFRRPWHIWNDLS